MRRARPGAIGLYDYLWPGNCAQGSRPRLIWAARRLPDSQCRWRSLWRAPAPKVY